MSIFLRMSAVCAALTVLISGCTTETSTSGDFQPQPNVAEKISSQALQPGDAIEISVEVDGKMEVSMHRATLNAFGNVTLPLVGDVRVGGLKPDQARSVIAGAYGSYYVNPPVIMLTKIENPAEEGEWGYVTVTGKVGRPGRVKITSSKGIKLTQLIQEAGGFSGSAKQTEIRITRISNDGSKKRITVDYTEIGQEGNVEADVSLIDGDIVYIPERIF